MRELCLVLQHIAVADIAQLALQQSSVQQCHKQTHLDSDVKKWEAAKITNICVNSATAFVNSNARIAIARFVHVAAPLFTHL